MTLEQALEIVKDHIRIGKGMELVNGIPEALEMVVEELQQYKERAEIYALMLETSFTEQEIEDAYEKAIEVYRQAKEV
jgi:hypothetical protein